MDDTRQTLDDHRPIGLPDSDRWPWRPERRASMDRLFGRTLHNPARKRRVTQEDCAHTPLLLIVLAFALLGGSSPAAGRSRTPPLPAPAPTSPDAWIDLKGLNSEGAISRLSAALDRVPQTHSRDSVQAAYRRFMEEASDESSIWEANRTRLSLQVFRMRNEADSLANSIQLHREAMRIERTILDALHARKTSTETADELRAVGARITAQESLVVDLQRELDALVTRSARADTVRATAATALSGQAARKTVRLCPTTPDQMIGKVRDTDPPQERQNAKLREIFGKLRGTARETYIREAEPYVDSSSVRAFFNRVRYGEPGGQALNFERGRVFCRYYNRESSEIGVGLALEMLIEVPPDVLRPIAPGPAVVATAVADVATRTVRTGTRMYKNLDAGSLGMTWPEAVGKLNEANRESQDGRTNWRLPTPVELLELRDLVQCPDNQTPCCVFPALAVRVGLRYWTSEEFQAGPGFNRYRTVSFSRANPQSEETPQSSGCGIIVVSSN